VSDTCPRSSTFTLTFVASLFSIYQIDKKTCGECHEQCKGSCRGPLAEDCFECKNVKDGKFCVASCPFSKYSKGGICISCHESCNGCAGPRNIIADDGCLDCDNLLLNGTVQECLMKNATCPGKAKSLIDSPSHSINPRFMRLSDGFFKEYVGPYDKHLAGKSICRQCHPRCKKCTGYGFHESVCSECAKYRRGEQCEDECGENQYADEESNTCEHCFEECQRRTASAARI
jgi:epidermal growth factor receptor